MVPESVPDIGSGLSLRRFDEGDVDALVAAFQDPEIALWSPGPQDLAVEHVLTWMGRRNEREDGDHVSWAIGDDEGALLGSVSVHNLNTTQRDAEIGYWVAPGARGRGAAARTVSAVAAWAFDVLDLHRITLLHAVENVGSCRVAAAAGFRLEGELRESYVYGDGLRHDEHLHARLAHDG